MTLMLFVIYGMSLIDTQSVITVLNQVQHRNPMSNTLNLGGLRRGGRNDALFYILFSEYHMTSIQLPHLQLPHYLTPSW